MKLRLLACVLLLAAVPGWTEEQPAQVAPAPEPSIAEALGCSVNAAPMTPADVPSVPLLSPPEVMSSAGITVCIRCREFVTKCQNPGQDAGKPCGDGDPPNTCTCQRCDHTFGCFP